MAGEPILIVDDNPTNLKLLEFVLTKSGYEVRCVAEAEAALAELVHWRPRLILLDLQLPGIDGFELARRLKADRAHACTRIIALTAYAMKGDEERALAAGCDGYATKPIDPPALRALVARHLAAGPVEAAP